MARLVFAKLADKAGFLPMPDRGGRPFGAGGETIDADDPFWMACIADESVKVVREEEPTPAPETSKKGS